MTKAEKILICTALLAIVLKVSLIPGGGILAVISFMLLSLLYFPLGFATLNQIGLVKLFNKESYQHISRWRIVGTLGLGMGLSAIVTGILFKIQFYPGAQINLLVGIVFTFLIGIIVVVRLLDTKADFYKKTLIKIVVFCIFGILLFLLSHSKLMYLMHRNDSAFQQESTQ